MEKEILILIPAFNEEGIVGDTVRDVLRQCGHLPVLVIDDGSRDKTAQEARSAGARVITLPVNLGIGGAVQTGFAYALRNGYRCVVRLDADGQHKARDIPAVIEGLKTGADIVVGSRFLNREGFKGIGMRRVGIRFIAGLCRLLNNGVRIDDPTSGFRGYSHKALTIFDRRYPADYPEPEELIIAANANCQMIEVPVTMAPRVSGQSSIGGWVSVLYIIKVVLAAFIERSRGKHGVG